MVVKMSFKHGLHGLHGFHGKDKWEKRCNLCLNKIKVGNNGDKSIKYEWQKCQT